MRDLDGDGKREECDLGELLELGVGDADANAGLQFPRDMTLDP